MFAITKAERDRRRYVRSIRRLVTETFQLNDREISEQNRTWNEWLALKRQECRDLRELLKGDVKEAFKARAIAILLAPRIKFAPFAWSDNTSLNDYLFLSDKVVLKELSTQLRDFALALLEVNIDAALVPDADEDLRRTLFYYNRYILEALILLEEDDPRAADLFSRYQINDPVAFWNMDEASGYNPICNIFHNPDVPEKWKRLADEKVCEVIRAEQEGCTQPRNDWEKALSNYVNHIQLNFYGEQFPYSIELFASQVDFILGLPNIDGHEYFNSWHTARILRMLDGEDRKGLRYRFTRHVILEDRGEYGTFKAFSDDTMTGARMILEEFGDTDPELRTRLDAIIAEGEARMQENQEAAHEKQTQTDAVMAQMR